MKTKPANGNLTINKLSNKFHDAVMQTLMEEALEKASQGDVVAAKSVLASIAHYLNPEKIDPNTNEPYPVPHVLRAYLSNAFYKMANGDHSQKIHKEISADTALHLTRSGRPNWGFMEKRLGAYLVYQAMYEDNATVLEATLEAADFLQTQLQQDSLLGPWRCFNNRTPPSSDTLQTWYFENINFLDSLRHKYP